MATDFTVFSRRYYKTSPLDSDIKVMQAYVTNSAAETNQPVPIPWENVTLVKIAGVVAGAAIDNVADLEIDFELNAAGGTEMMTMTVTKNSAVGAIFEATVSNQSACENLNASDSGRDAIWVEIDGSATPTGAMQLYFYFEPDLG